MKKLPVILLLVLLGGFLFGLTHLFKLRFEAGDIYPEYSSLRADPLGVRAFYESLDNLLAARRNYRPFSKLGDGRDTTLFYLGTAGGFMTDGGNDLRLLPEEFKSLESFAVGGGRLVISFFPAFQKFSTNRFRASAPPNSAPPLPGPKAKRPVITPKKGPLGEEEEFADARLISIRERWGLDYNYEELLKDDNGAFRAAPAFKIDAAKTLPGVVPCHTALFFEHLTNSWRVIYARKKDRPVIVERKYGAGAIVLCADSYLFSNEALLKERSPELLAWMVGPSRSVVFDETHLGVQESPGITALARKYRLHGFFAGLCLLAGLFVWRNATSFVPPSQAQPQQEPEAVVTGKDSASGFVNLLRRNVPAREVLAVCLAEWKKSCSREQSRAKLQRMQAVIDLENQRAPDKCNPIQTYRAISNILSKTPTSPHEH